MVERSPIGTRFDPLHSISVFFFFLLEWSIQLKQYCVLEDTAIIGELKKIQLPSELGNLRTLAVFFLVFKTDNKDVCFTVSVSLVSNKNIYWRWDGTCLLINLCLSLLNIIHQCHFFPVLISQKKFHIQQNY